MKVLVTYISRSGNTRKVAEAIAGALDADTEIKQLKEVDNLDAYDFSFVGFPIEGFGPAKEAVQFLSTKAAGKKVALFTTHAAHEEAPQLAGWLEKCSQAASQSEVLGVFNCRGDLAQRVKEVMIKSDDPQLRAWGEASKPTGNPDETRLERARAFAREMIKSF